MRSRAVFALLAALAATAEAQKIKVAVLPFDGPKGARAQAAIAKALAESADLVPAAQAAAAGAQVAKRGVPAVAAELGAQVVVLGGVRRDKGLVLAIEVRNAAGDALRLLEYALPGGRLDAATLTRARNDVAAAVGVAATAALAVPEEEEEEPPPPPPPPAPRASYVDGWVGLLLTGRSFGFGKGSAGDGLATCQPGPTSCPGFRGPIAAGLRVDVSGYPLALLASRGGAWRYLNGLGIGATWDIVAWPDSEPVPQNATTCGGAATCRLGTGEQRVEAGLRYRWRFSERFGGPSLLGSLQYGWHAFSIDPVPNGGTLMPSVAYHYLDLGVGARLPFLRRFSVAAWLNGRVLLATGDIHSAAEYGPGGGGGLRASLAGDGRVWRGVTVRVDAFYEVFWLGFDNRGMPAKSTDGSASDAYWGVVASGGWVY